MRKPLVSVITVVYNGATTLEKTILSVAGQTFRDMEYIIVDGGSKDATPDIIHKHSQSIHRWISEPDKGVYDAMNKGIRLAEGEWLYFLGSDDLFYDNNVLSVVFGAGSPSDADLVYGDVLSPSFNGPYDGEFSYDKLLSRNLSHQAAFYKKSLFTRLGDYDQRYRMHADWDFNLRCFSDPAVRTHYNNVVVATFGAEGISAGHDILFLRERLIPAKLQWLDRKGIRSLRGVPLYDEWWRFLRNAGFRDRALQKDSGLALPEALNGMLHWQRTFPANWLRIGLVSKFLMFSCYCKQRITAVI